MGVVIDTSLLIAGERGRLDIAACVAGRESELFYLSVISASELLHGVWRADQAATRTRRSAFVEEVLRAFPILHVDLAVARTHAQLWAELSRDGSMIGPHDLWIAASCLAHGHVLATANLRELERVPGLDVENWLDAEQAG